MSQLTSAVIIKIASAIASASASSSAWASRTCFQRRTEKPVVDTISTISEKGFRGEGAGREWGGGGGGIVARESDDMGFRFEIGGYLVFVEMQ